MLKKRVISIFLSIFIVIGVVASDYSTVMAVDIPTAFWGTLEYSRAFFTAMQTGGALDRGINFEDFTKSTQRQWMDLAPKVMEAYQLFCFYKEKVVVSAEHPDWTMEQINSEAVTRSFKLKNDFEDNAIKVFNTTGKITLKDWGYWQEFCKEFSSVAKNGLGSGGDEIGNNTVVNSSIYNNLSSATPKTNIGANTFVFDGNYYIYNGQYKINDVVKDWNISDVPNDRIRIPYIGWRISTAWEYAIINYKCTVDVNRLTGEIIVNSVNENTTNYETGGINNYLSVLNDYIENTNFPQYVLTTGNTDTFTNSIKEWSNQYVTNLSVFTGGSQALDWQYKAQEALDDSVAGSAIKKGNTAQKIKTVVREGSVPIKRSSLKEEEQDGTKVVSGVVGWDIPQSRVIEGTIANPAEEDEEIRQIGVIDVPAEDIIDRPEDEDIVIPADTPIVVPEDDVIDGPVVPVPIQKILEIQYGPFYPTSMDITSFFPFCIPFDIAYCINKFRVGEGEAPVITIPIVYPRILQPTLGESYIVTIDFNDYIALRNIIRYFILLLFLIGIMQITRNLIRG